MKILKVLINLNLKIVRKLYLKYIVNAENKVIFLLLCGSRTGREGWTAGVHDRLVEVQRGLMACKISTTSRLQ